MLKINATGEKPPKRTKIGRIFLAKVFAGMNFSITFALAFSNGGIAQLVRAHDS